MLVDDLLTNSAEKFPQKVACVDGDRRVPYAELDARSNRLAHALAHAGVQRGDRVGVFLDNSVESVIAIFGILKAGAAFVVINPTTKADKVVYMLNDCAANAIVVGGHFKPILQAVDTEVDSVRCVVTCGETSPGEGAAGKPRVDFERDLAGFPAERPSRRNIDMDLAAIIYTSGSTGRPKGVTVTHLNVISAATSITQYLENTRDDVILNVLPLAFDYGLYQVLMSAKMGATLVMERSFAYPYQIVQRVKQERVTGFPGVPTIFAMLVQMKDLDPSDFDSVTYVTNTAAALPPAHILRLRDLFRKARIYSMYGVTECKRVTYLPPAELDRRPTSVGRGMPNEEVYIVDENGNRVGPGVIGELVVRGSNVMQGYWRLPEETSRVLRPGRYPWERVLCTGDLFTMDEEGYLYFVARKDDIIKSRGEKVSPREVENAIYELPEVRDVAVVGVPDPILGEAVKAVVVRADGRNISEKEIIAHCSRRLENFMVPKTVEFRDSLPTTATGKIRRATLRAEAAPIVASVEGESE